MAEYKIYNLKDPKTGQEEPQISSKEEFDTLKQKVKPDQIKNPRTGQQGDAETVVKEEDTKQADAVNIAKELGKVLRDALQDHGDELQGAYLKNLNTRGVTVKIVYKPDEQGQQTEDEFNFNWQNGNISLEVGGQSIDLGQIQNRSGRSFIQKDILKDKLLGFLKSHDTAATAEPSDAGQIPDGQPVQEEWPDDHLGQQDSSQSLHEDAWESEEAQNAFIEAVKMYRCAKDKESIKNLFKACRPYKAGNTIQEKLKGAVDWYNWFTENPPKNTRKQVFLEDDPENDEGEQVEHDIEQAKKYFWKAYETALEVRSFIDASRKSAYATDWIKSSEFDDILHAVLKLVSNMKNFYDRDINSNPDSELADFEDPVAQETVNDDDDEPAIKEEDEFGPEVGDEVEYGDGHYKLYGYCGYEVVLQNVDDERDFKIVKPAEIGMGKQQVKETEYIDPEQLPDDEPNQEEI